MSQKQPKPTEGELVILRVLWERGPKSVREIQQVLNESRPTGYTTVLKLIQIMTEKGLVDRDEDVRKSAAWVLEFEDRGSLEVGKRADVLVLDGPVEHLPYRLGHDPVETVLRDGEVVWQRP